VVSERAPLPVTVRCGPLSRYGPEVEAAVYFCCLEALQNVTKHAGPTANAVIEVGAASSWLLFSVCDDGRGFQRDGTHQGAGLTNMRDRFGAVGGLLDVRSVPGEGTQVEGRVPV
jgi:signal transduction histidine kinase